MEISKFATFFKISGFDENMKATLDIMDSLSSYTFNGDKIPLGYMIDNRNKTMKIPVGYGLPALQRLYSKFTLNEGEHMYMPVTQCHKKLTVNITPFPYQASVLKDVMNVFSKDTQVALNLPTGRGKTITALMIANQINAPTLIVVKDTELKKQWIKGICELYSHCGISNDDIYNITGIGALSYIDSMYRPHPFYIATHAALRSIHDAIGYDKFNKQLYKMGVGLKIIDEFDLEFRNIIEFDLNTSIRYNIYLSATDFKSNKSDDLVFQRTFKHTFRTGAEYFKDDIPNRDCRWVYFKSRPNQKERFLAYNFRGDFAHFNYNSFIFEKRLPVIKNLISPYIKEFMSEYAAEDRCIIYVEKIETCNIMYNLLLELGIHHKYIGVVNSNIESVEKTKAFQKKIIVTTVQSCGRGLDLKNVVYAINFEVYASLSLLKQHVGRIGRVGGKRGVFVNFTDISYPEIIRYDTKKHGEIDTLFDKIEVKYFDAHNNVELSSRDELRET